MSQYSSANSAISSHTRLSAKTQNTNATSNIAANYGNNNVQNGAGGGYGSKAKQQIAVEQEREDNDIMQKYMEQQEKHRLLMIQNQKRRKDQEKKLKEETEKKKKEEEIELQKRKDNKQQAYVKFLRSNTTKIADNLKQNLPAQNQSKGKASTSQNQKRPTYTVTTEQKQAEATDQSKPKKQWNTNKTNIQSEKDNLQKENREPIKQESQQQNQRNYQQQIKYNSQAAQDRGDMNFEALDLNVPSGKDDFEKIKKMYAKQKQENGNDFIVNFEKEWRDDEESLENIRQSKLLDSLDLSTLVKKKPKIQQNVQNFQKQEKRIPSEFENIQENNSFDEDDYEKEKFEDEIDQKKKNQISKKEQVFTEKPSRAALQQQMKEGTSKNKIQTIDQKQSKGQDLLKKTAVGMKNESALVREAIGFDDDMGSDDNDGVDFSLGFQKKPSKVEVKEKTVKQENIDIGLTEAKLIKHNEIMEGTISLENKKYDVLSWAKNQQQEVDDMFSNISGKVSSTSQKKVKPFSAKEERKPPINVSSNNNIQQNHVYSSSKQTQQDIQNQIPKQNSQRKSVQQLQSEQRIGINQLSTKDLNKVKQSNDDTESIKFQNKTSNNQIIYKKQNSSSELQKKQQTNPDVSRPSLPIPPSKQKYQISHQKKVQQNNQTVSDAASQNSERVSKFKQKLQWNVQKNRRNNTKSPGSVGTREDDLNVDEFMRDDLISINKEEQQVQKEIYTLHFENIDKIRDIENKNNINLNLVSSKQIKELENNPSTIAKQIKPIYEYGEDELEKSLMRLDIALAKKQNKPQSAPFSQQVFSQQQDGYSQMKYQQNQNQQIQRDFQNKQIPNQLQNNIQPSQQLQNNMNFMQQQIDFNNILQQQQQAPNNLITQQLLILQQQQQLILQQQQQISAAALKQENSIGQIPQLVSNQVNSMKVQQILNANQLTYMNLAQQNDSLTKIGQNYDSETPIQINKRNSKTENNDQQNKAAPQFGNINNNKQLNNNIKGVSGNTSVASIHGLQQQQSQYNYDINDLQSISQVNSVATSNNVDARRNMLKEQLDEEVESKISEMKSKLQTQQDKESSNSYKQKHIVKKEIKQKKQTQKEEKQLQKELEENPDGMMKFNPKLKALLLANVEEEEQDESNNYQDNSFE